MSTAKNAYTAPNQESVEAFMAGVILIEPFCEPVAIPNTVAGKTYEDSSVDEKDVTVFIYQESDAFAHGTRYGIDIVTFRDNGKEEEKTTTSIIAGDPDMGWAYDSSRTVRRTEDGGKNWVKVVDPLALAMGRMMRAAPGAREHASRQLVQALERDREAERRRYGENPEQAQLEIALGILHVIHGRLGIV